MKKEENDKYKFIDLCCGIGGFHIALKELGGECVLACEIDKDCQEIYQKNFDITPKEDIFGLDISQIPNFDILISGFPCFVAGTNVLTKDGYKKIEEVTIDDKLLTHQNKFQKILNLQTKSYTGELFQIRPKYHPEMIECTPEHPFYVREKKVSMDKDKKKSKFYFEKPIWKKACELTENDLLGMPINQKEIIPEFTYKKQIHKQKFKDVTIRLDKKEYWFMMGYFIGDGWIEDGKKPDGRLRHIIRFSIADKDENMLVEKIRSVLPITDKKANSGACKKYGCCDFLWWNLLKEFGRYAHGKKIPEWVQDAPKDLIEEFIKGYILVDGNMKENLISITSVSKDLVFGIQRLYLKLGHLFSVDKFIRPKTCVIQGRTCNQRDTYTVKGYLNKERKYTSFIEDGYVWFAIFKMDKREVIDEIVYNFEVEEDNSYIVENIIVHNCQSFSQSGKQQGFADKTRGTIFFKLLEILKEKKPKYFILENVKNLISHDKGKTWNTIYNALIEVGYLTYPKPIIASPLHFGVPQNRERVFIIGINKDLDKLLKPYPTFERQETCLYDILQKDEEIDQKEMQKLKISAELEEVLNLWEEFVQYFKKEGIKLPGFPIWTEYFVEEFDISDLPAWKGKFVSQNIKFYNENSPFLKGWLTKARNCQHFKGSLTKLEWQCGAFDSDDSLFNLLFQLRPSGVRVKRINYSPALVAMAQIVYIGKLRRKLSSREVARLQSFPDTYEIHPNLNKCYKQFGNAVNVEVVKKIAEFLLN